MKSQRFWIRWMLTGAIIVAANAAHATDLAVAADTYVDSNRPAMNFGAQSNLRVKPTSAALLAFDLSSLPSGTTASQVSKATLWLYVNRIDSSNAIVVKPVTSTWNESAVTYNAVPSVGSQLTTFTPATAQQFIAVDVTSQVQSWITTPSGNYGLALTAAVADVQFDSKENDENSHAPRLDITLAGATGASGAAASISIGTTTTGAAGSSASVSNSGTSSAAVFNFTIPQGAIGATGPQGIQGIQGLKGDTGSTGAKGDKGDTGATGTIGAVAEYSAATTYATGQIVYCSTACATAGSSYISLQDGNLSKDPSDSGSSAYWQLIAKAGAGLTASSTAGQLYLTGTGGAIPTAPVTLGGDLSITSVTGTTATATIGASAITATKIQDQAVTTAKIATGAVTTNQIAASAAITGTQIAAGTITGASVGSNSNIAAGTITTADIATNANIQGTQLADSTIGIAKLSGTGKSSTTFLNGAGGWTTPSGGGFSMMGVFTNFTASEYSNQSISSGYSSHFSPVSPAGPTPYKNIDYMNIYPAMAPSACTATLKTKSTVVSSGSNAITATFTLYINGTSSISCSMTTNASSTASSSCTSSSTATIAAGDLLEYKYTQSDVGAWIVYTPTLICQ